MTKMETQHLYDYAGRNGISVLHLALPKTGSICLRDSGRDYIGLDDELIQNEAEERSRLIHELGHCATGSFYNRNTPDILRKKYEYKADKWAIRHLVPLPILIDAMREGQTERWQLAEYFCVTEAFMSKVITYYGLG